MRVLVVVRRVRVRVRERITIVVAVGRGSSNGCCSSRSSSRRRTATTATAIRFDLFAPVHFWLNSPPSYQKNCLCHLLRTFDKTDSPKHGTLKSPEARQAPKVPRAERPKTSKTYSESGQHRQAKATASSPTSIAVNARSCSQAAETRASSVRFTIQALGNLGLRLRLL